MKEVLPKVSIVTPSLNQGEFIERNILSVLNQDYKSIEHIIMDGGSNDNTLSILDRYGKMHSHRIKWFSEPDKGQADAINKGFLLSTGTILAWLNSDDEYAEGAISTVVRYFNTHQEIVFLYGKNDSFDEKGNIVQEHVPEELNVDKLINESCIIHQPSTFFGRCLLNKIGLLDSGLKYCMDLDLFIRIGKHISKPHILRVPETLAYFRRHAAQKTGHKASFSNQLACELETLHLSRKYGGSIFNKRHRNFLKRLIIQAIRSRARIKKGT